jgi:hypothetical protein
MVSRIRSCVSAVLILGTVASLAGLVCVTAAEPAGWQTGILAPPSVAAPPSAYAAQGEYAAAAATDAASKPRAATKSFKNTLSAAAAQAHKDGTITRWQLARVRMAIAFRPDAMAEAQACCLDQAVNDGLMRSPGDGDLDGFDWTQLLAFIKELLPMILQIISILG